MLSRRFAEARESRCSVMNVSTLYTAPVADEPDDHAHAGSGLERDDLIRIAVVAACAGAVWLRIWEPFAMFSVIGIVGLAVGGWPIFGEAARNLFEKRMTMELSMSIAILAAAAISEFFTSLVITLFVLIAEVLEGLTVSRGRRAIYELMELLPRSVTVRTRDGVRDVNAHELAADDRVLVNPGGLIPVDGTVVAGHSFVDQSRLTGESLAVEKLPGADVYAGTINQSGLLEIRAERVGRDTSYGRIIEAVETAGRSQAPVQRLADRLAGYLVYFAIGAALLTYLLTRDMHATIAVVIVAGACGIAAGTPLAILGAIGRAARHGVIVKGGVFIELLGKVDTVVVDKTGTLTFGRPDVRAVHTAPSVGEAELLGYAASAESRSEHPLGQAIVAHARARGIAVSEPADFRYVPGRGIAATVGGVRTVVGNREWMKQHGIAVPDQSSPSSDAGTELHVGGDGRYLGTVVIADTIRPEARAALDAIRRRGIRTVLLTGDTQRVAAAVGRALGVDEVGADLLPEMKQRRVQELATTGRTVAMLGDGVNDAPALVAANVGVAMGSGTDIARESADVVLIGNDLAKFAYVLGIARKTRGIIWQNFAGTLAVDAAGIALAAVGLLNPLLAAFVHVASEMVFILNSARLVPFRRSTTANELSGVPAATARASGT
jgi:Cd2+/Zn2+-exporting ATPase/Cu+-exporting ATPase